MFDRNGGHIVLPHVMLLCTSVYIIVQSYVIYSASFLRNLLVLYTTQAATSSCPVTEKLTCTMSYEIISEITLPLQPSAVSLRTLLVLQTGPAIFLAREQSVNIIVDGR